MGVVNIPLSKPQIKTVKTKRLTLLLGAALAFLFGLSLSAIVSRHSLIDSLAPKESTLALRVILNHSGREFIANQLRGITLGDGTDAAKIALSSNKDAVFFFDESGTLIGLSINQPTSLNLGSNKQIPLPWGGAIITPSKELRTISHPLIPRKIINLGFNGQLIKITDNQISTLKTKLAPHSLETKIAAALSRQLSTNLKTNEATILAVKLSPEITQAVNSHITAIPLNYPGLKELTGVISQNGAELVVNDNLDFTLSIPSGNLSENSIHSLFYELASLKNLFEQSGLIGNLETIELNTPPLTIESSAIGEDIQVIKALDSSTTPTWQVTTSKDQLIITNQTKEHFEKSPHPITIISPQKIRPLLNPPNHPLFIPSLETLLWQADSLSLKKKKIIINWSE